MAGNDTEIARLPMLLHATRPRPSLKRSDTTAAFVSQLLASRANMPAQRSRRRSSTEGAIGAYSAGSRIAVRRMPAGYRTSIVT